MEELLHNLDASIFHNIRKISSKEEDTEKDWTLHVLQTGFTSFYHTTRSRNDTEL